MSAPPPLDVGAAYDLTGRVAVVTGAGGGIGRATAQLLAAAGAAVFLGDVDEAGLVETAASIGERAHALPTDVSRRESVQTLVDAAAGAHGRLDVLANVAGVIHDAPVAELAVADLDRVFDVNVKGVLFGCQAALAVMVPQGSGSIVNVASSAAYQPVPTLAAYGMSKAAVVSLSRTLASEVAESGVRVNAVAPGLIESRMSARQALRPDGTLDPARAADVIGRTAQRLPLRVAGQPEDAAHAILYLATSASRFTTGQVLHPNGGTPMVS